MYQGNMQPDVEPRFKVVFGKKNKNLKKMRKIGDEPRKVFFDELRKKAFPRPLRGYYIFKRMI